jgi:hypothetical protein
MVQAATCRLLAADAQGSFPEQAVGICGWPSGSGADYFPSTSVLLCQQSFHQCSEFIHGSIGEVKGTNYWQLSTETQLEFHENEKRVYCSEG